MRSRAVTVVQAILVVNAFPAFVNLMSIPDRTDHWFVWTVKPAANARALGVMYGSACLLGLLGYAARTWPRQRVTFVVEERRHGGRLPVETPFTLGGRAAVAVLAALLLAAGIGLLFELSYATRLWPFAITPLVARILGVWLGCLGLGHVWTVWDGDRLRARALLLSIPPTGVLLALVPLLHRDDLRDGATGARVAYLLLAGAMAVLPLTALRSR